MEREEATGDEWERGGERRERRRGWGRVREAGEARRKVDSKLGLYHGFTPLWLRQLVPYSAYDANNVTVPDYPPLWECICAQLNVCVGCVFEW